MRKFIVNDLVVLLTRDVEEILLETEKLKRLDIHQLLECPATGKWNVVQVLEHLNAYNRYYLNAIEAAMNQSSRKDISYFKSGILGDYFTKMMAPKQNGVVKNKMKAMKGYVFNADLDVNTVVNEFVDGQNKLLGLLKAAANYNVNTVMVPSSLSKIIKFKLGDTFRFVIAHQKRHFIQIDNTLAAVLN